ncbi:extracellular solute-binding protein [Oscillospiraceae bacterium HV4-5-C5C]|nr:extracellular solute-binding protein [Oscillospiraceae bacterium HV4-5-C5C]
MKRAYKTTLIASLLPLVLAGCTGGTGVSSGTAQVAESSTVAQAEAGTTELTSTGAAAASTVAATTETLQMAATEQAATTLTIIARGGSHVDVINAVKDKFEQENNVTIEVLGLESDELKQKISLDAANANGSYDLAMADDPWMPEFAEAGIFRDLTEMGYEADSDFVQQSLDIGRNPYGSGDIYALPFSGNVQFFFYNKELLSSLQAEVPTDWAAVLDLAKAAKAAGTVGYVIRGQQGNPVVSDYLPILWSFGGAVFDDNWNVTVDSEAGKASLNFYLELLANGANYEKNDIVSAVSDGSAAMSLGWPSWYISDQGATAAYAVIPGKADADSTEYASGMIGNWMMGVTANSQQPELALKFLEYVTSAEAQKAGAEVGGVPTRSSVLSDPELLARYPYFQTLLDGTRNSMVRPRTTHWSEIETAYGTELSNAVAGTKSVDAALADAKTAIEKIMQ